MLNAIKLYLQTLKTIFSSVSTWIIILGCLLLNSLFICICPILMHKAGEINNEEIWTIGIMTNMVSLATTGFFCSIIGEIIANPNDRLFILSRPVHRSIYMGAKLSLAITISLVIAAFIILFYWILEDSGTLTIEMDGNAMVNPYFENITLSNKAITTINMCVFGGVFGCGFRYYLREMIASVIIFIFCLTYSVGFILLDSVTNSINVSHNYLMTLEFFTVPLAVILPASCITIVLSHIINLKTNVKW